MAGNTDWSKLSQANFYLNNDLNQNKTMPPSVLQEDSPVMQDNPPVPQDNLQVLQEDQSVINTESRYQKYTPQQRLLSICF